MPFVPLGGCEASPNMRVIKELTEGSGLKHLGFNVKRDILLVIKERAVKGPPMWHASELWCWNSLP